MILRRSDADCCLTGYEFQNVYSLHIIYWKSRIAQPGTKYQSLPPTHLNMNASNYIYNKHIQTVK